MKPPFEAILWDNDGVLVDTEHIYFKTTRRVLAEIGVELDLEGYQRLFLSASGGAWHLARELGYDDARVNLLRQRRNDLYMEALEEADFEIPGAREVLESLHPQYRMAVVTSSRRAPFEAIHRKTGFMRYFEFALVREDYERSKPDPEPYLTAAQRLGVPANECLVIEDSERGLRAAKAAGMSCWVIPTDLTSAGDLTEADQTLSDVSDVPARLARLTPT
ncbi:MAG: HAD family phosphatase [Candidatus Latescibacterota bacterium]|jgi:HAD superfamily hydrolase (TIGR01509 family)